MDELPRELSPATFDNVRKLEITYNRRRPGEGSCAVEYVGGRIEIFEVDR